MVCGRTKIQQGHIFISAKKKIFNKGGLELGCLCSSSKVPTTELKRIEAELRARKTGFTYTGGER